MNMVSMPRYSMAEDTFSGSFDSAPQIFSSDTTFRRSAQDDKKAVHSLKQVVTSQMQKGSSFIHSPIYPFTNCFHLSIYPLTHLCGSCLNPLPSPPRASTF